MRNDKRGMTLIEVLISTSVIAIIFVVVSNFVIDNMETQRYISEQNDAVVEVRKSIKKMTSEIRETINADTGSYPLDTANDQEFIFYSDIDKDDYVEKIRYYLDGTNLMRTMTNPEGEPLEYITEQTPEILASYVQNTDNPIFYYYNENYPEDDVTNPLSQPIDITEIRMLKINLSINVDPLHIPDTRELEVYVHLRNLKENF